MSELEYFTEINQIPKRTNKKVFDDIISKFLDSRLKIAKLSPKVFADRTHSYRASALQRYVKVHSIPVKVYCINDQIYLEKY